MAKRYEAYGWNVIKASAYDQDALYDAYAVARASKDQPTLIMAHSIIGHGAATVEGSNSTHGQALGEKEMEATKKKLGWPAEPFYIPAEAKAWCQAQVQRKQAEYGAWEGAFSAWAKAYPEAAAQYELHYSQAVPAGFEESRSAGMAAEKASTRQHSGKVIQALAKALPWFIGGSADLARIQRSAP